MAQIDQAPAQQSRYRQTPTPAQLAEWVADFERDGFVVLRGLLAPEEIAAMREKVVQCFDEPDLAGSSSTIIRHQMFLRGPMFEDLLDRSPVIDFVEAILGDDCHMISMNAIYTRPGQGIDSWHVDEAVHFPRPAGVPLDPRIPAPCFIVQALYYLVDVDEPLGPTQFVPGSHRSGRKPDPELVYEGRGIHNVIAKAGDCTLQNGQSWHRGATNTTNDRARVVQQVSYGRRFIAQRLYPFVNFHMPEELLERSSPHRQRLLGVHPRGPYG
jgi:ectoine hydroxylase-related dioxygenase (phytanoyl-CoA dioxygenase family)